MRERMDEEMEMGNVGEVALRRSNGHVERAQRHVRGAKWVFCRVFRFLPPNSKPFFFFFPFESACVTFASPFKTVKLLDRFLLLDAF